MKSFFKLLILSLLVFLASCSKNLEPSGISDAEIIQLIQESDLMDVSMTDLPSRSQNVVIEDYFEYIDVASRKASALDMKFLLRVEVTGLDLDMKFTLM